MISLIMRFVLAPALLAGVVSANIDLRYPPLAGREKTSAVFLTDGQVYFGHLADETDETMTLRGTYYLQDAKDGSGGVVLARRGGELHEPADGMRLQREKILAVETVGRESAVARAIGVERSLVTDRHDFWWMLAHVRDPRDGADVAELVRERDAVVVALAQTSVETTSRLAEVRALRLPIPAPDADRVQQQALADLAGIRRAALVAVAEKLGTTSSDLEAAAPTTARTPTLIAPSLQAIVTRARQMAVERADAATRELTTAR